MTQLSQTIVAPAHRAADAVLAMNLVTARTVAGITQQKLAEISRISRATIAQIETGTSDPRLSTIVELARALELPVILLLIGLPEIRALGRVLDHAKKDRPSIGPHEMVRMKQFVATGMLKDRVQAALVGATAVESFSNEPLARTTAALFSAFLPGAGTEIGAILGELLAESISGRELTPPPHALTKAKK
jgi:transcriptional regulator with XRE-family HTH domain